MRRRQRIDRGIKVRSDSIYVLSSPAAMAYAAAPRLFLIAGLLALPLLLAPWPYFGRVALSACTIALLGLAFDFLAHHAGLVCLGGAFFFGVGGYATAIANVELGLPVWASMPAAAIAGATFCTLVIAPCLHVRGIYFAVLTLIYPLLANRLIEAADVLGGTEGFRGIAGLPSQWHEQYTLVAILLAAVFALRRFAVEPAGLVLRAIKDDHQAVRASGINVAWRRAQAVWIAAFLGAFAGAFYTHLYRSVGVSAFALDLSILPIAATIIGGAGTLVGAVCGSLILIPLGELLRDFGSLRIALFAIVLTAFTVLRSEGIIPFLARKYGQWQRWVEV